MLLGAEIDAAGWVAIISAISTLVIAPIIAGIVSIIKLWRADAHTDQRVDLLWDAHVRRGLSEGLNKNLIAETSTVGDSDMITLSEEARKAYEPLAHSLRKLRSKLGPDVPDSKFAEEAERRWGAWLSRHICRVLGVTDYACLQMAVMVSKEDVPDDREVANTAS